MLDNGGCNLQLQVFSITRPHSAGCTRYFSVEVEVEEQSLWGWQDFTTQQAMEMIGNDHAL